MSKNQNLQRARRLINDEFYTQFEDINAELQHYKHHFKNKVVYCNCDDPTVSNFFRYFSLNFEHLGLKKLIATCYKNQQRDLFSQHDVEKAIYLEYKGDRDGNRRPDSEEIEVKALDGNGDFRSEECIELLKQADIVCTNPPFSLFRQYVSQLTKYNKKFLIIGSQNAITYKEIFPVIKSNDIWLGVNSVKEFEVKENNPKAKYCHDRKKHFQKFGNVVWFTNIEHNKRNEFLYLNKEYTQQAYPHYDNYDAIEVSRVNNIPKNWGGVYGCTNHFSYQIQFQAI